MRLIELKEFASGNLPSPQDAGIKSISDILSNDTSAKVKNKGSAAPGTYAGLNFDAATLGAFASYMKAQNIPNAIPENKLHTTLLYSKKNLPNYEPSLYSTPFIGNPTNLEKWESQPDDEGKTNNCLVQRFDCPDLCQRHTDLMDEHQGEYDYDEYKPHVTLSYDIGNAMAEDFDPFNRLINITGEYMEEIK